MNICLCMLPQPPTASRSPYTTLFRSRSPSSRRPPNAPTTAWSTRSPCPPLFRPFPTRYPAEPPAPHGRNSAAVHRARGPTPARTEPPATPAAERDHARRRADPAIPGSPRSPRSHVPEPGAGTRATEDRGPASPRTWRPEADATAPPPSPPVAAHAPARQPSAPRPPGHAPTGCWSGSSAARTPHDRPGSHTEESVPCRPDDLPASAPALAVPPPANAAHRWHEPAPTGPSP